jgi:hypothetical protein
VVDIEIGADGMNSPKRPVSSIPNQGHSDETNYYNQKGLCRFSEKPNMNLTPAAITRDSLAGYEQNLQVIFL